MADTRRGISWALERPCPLRTGGHWPLPDTTHHQLADLTAYARALDDRRVLDGVCVTAYTFGSDSAGRTVMLPCSGFRVSLALAPFGGEPAVRAACSACEANVSPAGAPSLAGCHGFLDVWPDSEELEAQLRDRARLKGIEEDVARLFPRTTPLWYGFWIESPLRRARCEALLALLEGTDDPTEPRDDDLRHFLAALRAAIDWELPLHVAMAPPGHTDFGIYTVFPHCPRCKAHAPLPPWQESYPDAPVDCAVCGRRYNPAETHREEPMDLGAWDARELKNVLGPAGVEGFRRRFLAHRGCPPEQIEDVLDRENNGPLKRRIRDLRRRQAAAHPSPATAPGPLPPVLTLGLGAEVTLRLRLIPAGEFQMGRAGPPEDIGCEGPQHPVRIPRPFYLGESPVTQAQYLAVTGQNPSRFRGDPDLPVERVSWFAAQEFCLRLSGQTGRRARLPTEAEWEYACRAGSPSPYHWGEEPAADRLNCKTGDPLALLLAGQEETAPSVQTTAPGRFPPNAWGLHDLHGNVQEWCEDEWHDRYDGAPADGSAWVTPGDENPFRVQRGGSCWHHAAACTSASRQMARADAEEAEDPEDDFLSALFRDRPPVGFRVVVEAD